MVIERRLGYSEARERGIGRLGSLRGAWDELKPGSTNRVLTVVDENTVQLRENILPMSSTVWPIDSIETYRGAAIDQLPNLRWKGDPQQVKSSVTRGSEVYIPDNVREQDATRDQAQRKRWPLPRD